jgi:hypothetical protein
MAGARGPARRQLALTAPRWLARLTAPRNRHRAGDRRRGDALPAPGWRALVRVAVPLVAVLIAAPPLLRAARRHPYFRVHEVRWLHHGRLDRDVLRAALEVPEGTSIWDVDVAAAAARLRSVPWVRSAAVRRELPDRLVVRVHEDRPAAILAVTAPHPGLFYVAADGRIFAPVGDADARDLPYVTGLTGDDLDGREGFGPKAVHVALALLRLVPRRTRGVGALSEVHVDRADGVTLVPMRPAVPIELGWGDLDGKLARLARVLPLWSGREAEMAGVSCLFEDQVIVRTRTARAVQRPKPASAGA